MIAANERKASRFRLVTFLATVAILRTFQYGPTLSERSIMAERYWILQLYVTFDFLKDLFIVASSYQILIKHAKV